MSRHQLWGGRFAAGPAEALKRFNDSLSFDIRLLQEDVEASIAWAEALASANVLSDVEAAQITSALRAIASEPVSANGHEDVHSLVESLLYDRIGTLAGKLHTGRSRNDQVATDFRLYLKRAMNGARETVLELAAALTTRAEQAAAIPMPGYTHLKRAEPVTFGHWCLAYVEMLLRDADRLLQSEARADESPLGCGALAGSPLPVDRHALAAALGFARPSANSLDAVSDRDGAADYLYAASLLLVHLSRMAEDLIFFTSDEAGFAELPDELSTGSSRMPHKKNPDVLELVRGHAGRAIGELTGLLALMKGIPLAYDKDMQLDKEPVFRMHDVLAAAVPALTGVVSGLILDEERMRASASGDGLLATQLADAIAARGVPFREAHEIVGARIAESLRTGRTLRNLGPGGGVTGEDLDALDVDRALAAKSVFGGTSPLRVAEAARNAAARIAALRSSAEQTGVLQDVN